MKYSKILITGATGFIGSRLCEMFILHHGLPVRALVRNFSKAARIARLGTEMIAGDLSDEHGLDAALSGCDAVVHLAYAPSGKAERNLIAACRRARVKRLVHISSMAVYGPHPGPECAREETATIGSYKERYSDSKARAERIVQRAINSGLSGVILRPTIVYGPYSPFVIQIIKAARAGRIQLLDDGKGVCNAVFVDDVCNAIGAALESDRAPGKAFLITADRAVSWRQFNLTFANMVSPLPRIDSVSAAHARAYWAARKPSIKSNIATFKRLVASSDFHDQLGTVPVFHSAITLAKGMLMKVLPADRLVKLRNVSNQTIAVNARRDCPDPGRIVREDFHLEFSNDRATRELGWKPAFDFAAGAGMTRSWLEFAGLLEPVRAGGVSEAVRT